MKVYLLYQDRDFDFGADLPPGYEDLNQDLELTTLLQAMAGGDKFLYEVSAKVLLASLHDPEAIGYRQRVLADCLAQPEVIREMYAVAVGALADKRHLWGATAARTRILRQTSRARSGTWKPTWPACGNCGRSPTTMPGSSAPMGCGRCSPRCSASWTTGTSRRSAST